MSKIQYDGVANTNTRHYTCNISSSQKSITWNMSPSFCHGLHIVGALMVFSIQDQHLLNLLLTNWIVNSMRIVCESNYNESKIIWVSSGTTMPKSIPTHMTWLPRATTPSHSAACVWLYKSHSQLHQPVFRQSVCSFMVYSAKIFFFSPNGLIVNSTLP